MDKCVCVCVDRWTDGWMNVWVNGWVSVWMHDQMDGKIDFPFGTVISQSEEALNKRQHVENFPQF